MSGDLDATLWALADPTRRGIVELLRSGPQRPSAVAEALGASRPALSRHLRVLREAGLVEESPAPEDARARMLSLRREPFDALREWVIEVEEFWGDQLAAFKAHAERGARKKKGRR